MDIRKVRTTCTSNTQISRSCTQTSDQHLSTFCFRCLVFVVLNCVLFSGGGDTFFLSLLWCMCSILSSSLCEFLSLFLHPEHIKNSSISFNQKSMNRSIYRKDMVHHRLLHVNHPAQVSTPCV